MQRMHVRGGVGLGLIFLILIGREELSAQRKREIDTLVELTLMRPSLKAEAGFVADLLVPPGDLYDPLSIRPRDGGGALIGDDGSQAGVRGGRIWSVVSRGNVSTFIETARLMPVLGFGIAPPEFGNFAGQIFMLTQPRAAMLGGWEPHLIQYIDPNGREDVKVFCALPPNGGAPSLSETVPGKPSAGIASRFGPAGTPFGNRFFAVTLGNATIYQATADGACKPFFAQPDFSPRQINFSEDGTKMLVGGVRRVPGAAGDGAPGDGVVLAIGPDGSTAANPLFTLPREGIWGLAMAPKTFGAYGGQLFVAYRSVEGGGSPDEETKGRATRPANGKVYRFTPDGKAHLVLTGLYAPFELAFIDNSLWIGDINSDFIPGFYLPDGFVVRIRPQ